jgi:hypothetical protein
MRRMTTMSEGSGGTEYGDVQSQQWERGESSFEGRRGTEDDED